MPNGLGEAVTREIARLVWEENREALEAYWSGLLEQREREETASGSGAEVSDLERHRRRRSS